MIKFTEKIKQDFLSTEWMVKLDEAGVNFIDAKYYIVQEENGEEFIATKDELPTNEDITIYPTYSLSELIYKLPEYLDIEHGELIFQKDAPFYMFGFKNDPKSQEGYECYPLYSAANLLLYCTKNNLNYVRDVSDK